MSVANALGRTNREDRSYKYSNGFGLQLGNQNGSNSPIDYDSYYGAKPRIDENHNGMMYGDKDYDRGHPHPRPKQDPFKDRGQEEMNRLQKEKENMEQDIILMKERQRQRKEQEEEEKRQNYEMLTNQFPWERNRGHGAPRSSKADKYKISQRRETDLFLDTLGGPGGTVVRENGSPNLSDPRYTRQQQNFQSYTDDPGSQRQYARQEQRMHDLRQQINDYKNEQGHESNYQPEPASGRRPTPKRSLDLDHSRGGAGAPLKDGRGKAVTRRPITLMRDDFGDSKIIEDIPGKGGLDLNFMQDDNRPYHPWGGQGGGAPIRDREGNVRTQIYGKLSGREAESTEVRKQRRRQEVLYNELKEGERQHKQNKDDFDRFMKAPQSDVAEVLLAGRVGKPKRDAITGEMAQHHLGNSDVSKLKMNYQEKTVSEKQALHKDLKDLADQRAQARELEKLKEKQESNAHFRNMDGFWGGFGGGAPKHSQIRKKANLTNSLFYPEVTHSAPASIRDDGPPTGLGAFADQNSPLPSYQKLYVDGDLRQYPPSDNSPRYVKSTLQSSHRNMFDANPESRISPRGYMPPPYATGGIY